MPPSAEFFTKYDQTLAEFGEMQDITHNGMTVTIPAYFQELEMPMHEAYMYGVMDEADNSSDNECIIFSRPDDVSDMVLLSEEGIAEMGDTFLKRYAVKKLVKGFEDLGHGIPDNAYTTLKSAYLVKTIMASGIGSRDLLMWYPACLRRPLSRATITTSAKPMIFVALSM